MLSTRIIVAALFWDSVLSIQYFAEFPTNLKLAMLLIQILVYDLGVYSQSSVCIFDLGRAGTRRRLSNQIRI